MLAPFRLLNTTSLMVSRTSANFGSARGQGDRSTSPTTLSEGGRVSGAGWSRVNSSRVGARLMFWARPGEAVNRALVDSAAMLILATQSDRPIDIPPQEGL